ncbi:hypothetical protein IC762_17605 [Bradyrhizobium genosp. L]|uniref:hypothetical protein n=1 Tax=Bradyrhizobium genosp. L TaxID=83637 RepID=UPI0018A2E2C4|nr:hypothetical protein [Bradyrhizobium genosp. L]QPF81642.1 hypothetical protein IC762_17605 [Bradyrhizobium genosp. L]
MGATENIRNLVPNIVLKLDRKVVCIELHCSDDPAPHVLFDDICEKTKSECGLCLTLHATEPVAP